MYSWLTITSRCPAFFVNFCGADAPICIAREHNNEVRFFGFVLRLKPGPKIRH